MNVRHASLIVVAGLAIAQIAGCPQATDESIIAGGVGDSTRLGSIASVTVVAPISTLSINGGTPIEVNWNVVATTNFAVVDIIFDVDENPNNDNEIYAEQNLSLTENTALLNTSGLAAGTYSIGVVLKESNEIAAFDYAAGKIVVNQRPELVFLDPVESGDPNHVGLISTRDNVTFDRSRDVNPSIGVRWSLSDPDSTVFVEIYLDPDTILNNNEIKLRQSTSQTGDSFIFNLPTYSFDPGTYRIVAIVSDGVDSVSFYAPGSIRLRSRLAGAIDLRNLGTPDTPIEGAVFEGVNPRDNAGSFVGSARDVDGDGFADFMTLAQFGKPQYALNAQRTGIGEAYLVYGRTNRFSGSISLNSTGTLFRGEVYGGADQDADPIRPSRGITCFAVLSDWDSDSIREFAFGLPFVDSVPVSPSDPTGFAAPLDAPGYFRSGAVVVASSSSLRPDLGFPGGNVFKLGEFGTLEFTNNVPRACHEGFYGPKAPAGSQGSGSTSFHRHLGSDLPGFTLGGARMGCRLSSNDFGDQFGETISAYQYDAIIMVAPNRDSSVSRFTVNADPTPGAGVVSIFYEYGAAGGGFYPWSAENTPPANSELGYPGLGGTAEEDIPHRGPYHYIVDDFRAFPTVIGPLLTPVVVSRVGSPGYSVDPDDNENPCLGFVSAFAPQAETTTRLFSSQTGAHLSNVAAGEDFNGDGLQDILIGAPFLNNGDGATFIVFGRLRNLVVSGELELEELTKPLNGPIEDSQRVFDGLHIRGAADTRLGQAQAGVGDFNADGLPDVAIGSPLLNDRRGGVAVLFGSRELINLTGDEILLTSIPDRGLGIIFRGQSEGDLAGTRVASAGDVDGDGIDDLLIAAPDRDVRLDIDQDGELEIDRTDCGVVYLIYGSSKLSGVLDLADVGTDRLPGAVFIGRNSGDFLGAGLGEQGDRSFGISAAGDVDGDGFGDLIFGSVSASPRDRVRAGEAYLIYGNGD